MKKLSIWMSGLAMMVASISASAQSTLSYEEVNKIYEKERPAMIAGYQKQGNPWAMDYPNWKGTATAPANPGAHSRRYLITYVNDIGHADYVKFSEDNPEMPIGTVIAKESFKLSKKGKLSAGALFFMEKVERSQAPDTDGWVYSRLKPNGKPARTSQKFCHGCHTAYAHQDSLGYPVKAVRVGFVGGQEGEPVASVGAGDAEQGKQDFQRCVACHQIGSEAKNGVGPVLTDVVGRAAGSFSGFSYSDSLSKAGKQGLVWDDATLFEWLAGPSGFLKKHLGDDSANSKMPLSFDDAELRNNIIAYLNSMSEGS